MKQILMLIIFSLISFDMVAMQSDFAQILEQLQRHQGIPAEQTAHLAHGEFIGLPVELQGRSTVHVKCDCNDLVHDGHFCGAHALAHAVDEEDVYGLRDHNGSPGSVVKEAFTLAQIGATKVERTKATNIQLVAQTLGLNSSFFALENGYIVSNFYKADEMPVLVAFKKLTEWREEFLNAGNRTIIRHAFLTYGEHVVLFSLIWDGEIFSIKIHDNLNEMIQVPSPIYQMAHHLASFFVEFDRVQYCIERLVHILVKSEDRPRYNAKFESIVSRANRDNNRAALLAHLFAQWVQSAKDSAIQKNVLTIATLNAPIKLLKRLHGANPLINGSNLIIKTYDAMLDVIADHKAAVDTKRKALLSVINAIKKSADEKVFSLTDDNDASALFEKAANLTASLDRY